ncbi:MAG: hypothetical protein IH600_15035 [Bacteroidetes bacterium]|nr:hypothetical protein [Bacteroidota bacterium]
MEREPLFEDDINTAVEGLQLVPDRLPSVLPSKHDIKMFRADLIERLTGNLGPLKAYLLVKLIEKIIAEKEEGVIKQLQDGAKSEFQMLYPRDKTAEVLGAKVSIKGRSYWTYPEDINAFEVELKAMEARLKGMKKAAEIDGRAMHMQVPDASISVSF